MSFSPDGLLPNMIAFNLGVELGQFAALALIMTAGVALFGYQMTGYWVSQSIRTGGAS